MTELEKYRKKIDDIDNQIINLIATRTAWTYKISRYKARNNILVIDEKREKEVYSRINKLAIEQHIDENFAKKVFDIIIEECRKIQRIKR